ncbi:MAG: hypothetical protein ABJL54_06555 [Halioglobus sp.]
MSENKPTETETILMALDQISQTIDVMTSVVNRLRNYVQEHDVAASDSTADAATELQGDRIIH